MRKKLNQTFNNQAGFSMMNLVITLALSGILGSILMKSMSNAKMAEVSNLVSADFLTTANMFQTKFLNRDFCMANVGGESINSNEFIDLNIINSPKYDINGNLETETVNGVLVPQRELLYETFPDDPEFKGIEFGNIRLMKITLIRPENDPDVYIDLDFVKENSKMVGGRDLKKRIVIPAIWEGTKIIDCNQIISDVVESSKEEAKKQLELGGIKIYKENSSTFLSTRAGVSATITSIQDCKASNKRCRRTSNWCAPPGCPLNSVQIDGLYRGDVCQRKIAGVCVDRKCMTYRKCGIENVFGILLPNP